MEGKGPPDRQPATHTEAEGATLDFPEGTATFTPGQVLGERYQILELLGRGGMGEVWRALDLKLRVEVALKALRGDLFKSERRLELLRQEVRAAREVVSPNVCRIFDLIEIEGRELVSMEYVDGATVLAVLQERGPLELKEAQDIASQFLAGLEAIHKAGLIHRDVKPENIMLTRAGRVVVMDFGLARQEAEGGGSVSGTPAYMAPEQAAGQTLDARADVYAAGVVLAEMVSPEGIKGFESRQSVWEGVRSEPAQVPDTPWAPVLKKAVAKDRERRYNSAHTLTRALEDVTLRVEGAEDLHPYPGLASFTEEDAEYFFGREAEVEQMWRRLEGPPRMLALVGPSGAGKTSFLRAGVVPSMTTAWTTVICTPGTNPQLALSRALAHEMAGDVDAMDLLLRFDDPEVATEVVSRWRRRGEHALLVVDQFEELFTQNDASIQLRFADLVSRFVLEADVHVLLSVRDDFLFRCHEFTSLKPVFFELTPLGAPVGTALRRAVVQPATKCGYRFEDDELVEEMLAEVEGERGALPLLAFAAARLWQKRDREKGLLTRQAYHDIGGVGGALAQHAEATIDRVGADRITIVRELFRNLVTAEGTRAVREWDELLSVFDSETRTLSSRAKRPSAAESRDLLKHAATMKEASTSADGGDPSTRSLRSLAQDDYLSPARHAASEVLSTLIDARLLTSYEIREEGREPTRRVEIIHESLLANWPRLVRWRTQDEEGAQLRDELRQAARAWDEHDRHDDRLWTGTAFREFQLWRERYPGGLTEIEEAFASAMTSLATRRRRRRRMAAATVVILLSVVATVLGVLWRRSVLEARRAEAARLLALARLEIDDDHTAALAWAITSLEMADTLEAREFAVEALWRGPQYFVMESEPEIPSTLKMAFSPDGKLLAASGTSSREVFVWSDSGERTIVSDDREPVEVGNVLAFSATGGILVAGGSSRRFRIWSVPDWRLINEIRLPEEQTREDLNRLEWRVVKDRLLTFTHVNGRFLVRSWPVPDGQPTIHGWWDPGDGTRWTIDPTGVFVGFTRGREVVLRPLESLETSENDRVIGRHPGVVLNIAISPSGKRVAAFDETGLTRLWSVDPNPSTPIRVLRGFGLDEPGLGFASENVLRRATNAGFGIRGITWPPDAVPRYLNKPLEPTLWAVASQSNGGWCAAKLDERIFFWPLRGPFPRVLRGHSAFIQTLAFVGEGDHLVSASFNDQTIRLWPLAADSGEVGRVLWERPSLSGFSKVVSGPAGQNLLVSNVFTDGDVFLLAINDEEPVVTTLWQEDGSRAWPVAFSKDGRRAAAGAVGGMSDGDAVIRVWDLETQGETVLPLRDRGDGGDEGAYHRGVGSLRFTPEGDLLSAGSGGVRLWDLETGTAGWLMRVPDPAWVWMHASRDTRFLLTAEVPKWGPTDFSNLTLHDSRLGTSHTITSHGQFVNKWALDSSGTIVVTSAANVIRVGPADGSEPHLLYGHEGAVKDVEISPDGRWIASGGMDTLLRLWPMPDLSRPPLHTLPREELIAKLKTLTNLRVVPDGESSTGWKLEVGPFPGWETVPSW